MTMKKINHNQIGIIIHKINNRTIKCRAIKVAERMNKTTTISNIIKMKR